MRLQVNNIDSYKKANEILYALEAIKVYGDGIVSKVALQKIIYLSTVLAPIKEIVLSFLRFQYNYRGPWNVDIQNTVDHLVAIGAVDVVSFKAISSRKALANYSISTEGSEIVKSLIINSSEEGKFWWITTVSRAAYYIIGRNWESEWSGLDRIVDLVYKDPSFLDLKENQGFLRSIEFGKESGLTYDLIQFVKSYLTKYELEVTPSNERKVSEMLIIAFLEFYANKLTQEPE